jgi:lipoprotein-anchoring transpeptidase ErfK/SrfK
MLIVGFLSKSKMLVLQLLRFSFVATLALLPAALPASAEVVVTIDKSTQRMTVVVDGSTRWRWPVSTGARSYDTPSGSYTAFRMEKDYYSKEWDDAPMPNSIFFTQRGHAIHGSYDKRLGRPVSHGCVRLNPANAAKLYSLVASQGVTNTKVVVTGQAN